MRQIVLLLLIFSFIDVICGMTISSMSNRAELSRSSLKLSPLVENMAVSKTIEIHSMTKDMEKRGITVYSLCVGEPDYQPPPEVVLATVMFLNK